MQDNFTFSTSSSLYPISQVDFDASNDQELLTLKEGKISSISTFSHAVFDFLFLFVCLFACLFVSGEHTLYKPASTNRWTSPFRFRYLDDSIPVWQQGIHQIPRRHPRLFQAVVSCGVFLGTLYDFPRWRHLYRVKQH